MKNHQQAMEQITYTPIGIIRSPFKKPKGTPIQPPGARGVEGSVELFPEYLEGLKDLDGFSHIMLIYHFHLAKRPSLLLTKPFMDDQLRGIFAIRAPSRPNPIGLHHVRVRSVDEAIPALVVEPLEALDNTPVIDIKISWSPER